MHFYTSGVILSPCSLTFKMDGPYRPNNGLSSKSDSDCFRNGPGFGYFW